MGDERIYFPMREMGEVLGTTSRYLAVRQRAVEDGFLEGVIQ
jgi:hypothetical protein